MKHLFIVNPVAGGSDRSGAIFDAAKEAFEGREDSFEMYITKGPKDAMEAVKNAAAGGEEVRIYSCGGDGTFNECVGGAVGCSNVAVAPFATGTGNDFIKTFGEDRELFFDVKNLLDGTVVPLDILDCNGRACIDIASVGLDARIGTDVHKYSGLPLIGGAAGYITSLVVNVIKGMSQKMHIIADGYDEEGEYTMVCMCNGNFYGGGFNPIKDARPDDGQMNILVGKKISRLKAAGVFGSYGKGEYEKYPDVITRLDTNEIEIILDKETVINVDGEAIYTDDLHVKLVPGAVNFIAPKGMTYFDKKEESQEETAEEIAEETAAETEEESN